MKIHQQTGLPPHSASPLMGKNNETNKKLNTNLILYEAYTDHWTNLRRTENRRKKEFNHEACEKETSNIISLKNNEKAGKYCTNEGTN